MGCMWNALGRREILVLFWKPAGQMLPINVLTPGGIKLKNASRCDAYCLVSRRQSYGLGLDSWVRIATRYGPDGPVIESRWQAKLSAHVQTGPGAHPTSCIFPGGKSDRRVALTTHLHLRPVKERVQIYLYSPSGPSWQVIGWYLPYL